MRRFFTCVQIIILELGLFLISSTPASAANISWVNTPVVKLSETPASWPTVMTTSCSGTVGLISVKGWPDLQDACIYGKTGGVQIAKYTGSAGQLYAVAFPLDTTYTQLRNPCVLGVKCLYGQAGDTLLLQVQKQNGLELALIKDFSKYLIKYTDDGDYYKFEGSQDWKYVSFGNRGAKAGAVAVSPNGKWGVVELNGSGFVRINLQTLEYKRVVAPSGEYGYGMDPIYELAITNDGSKLAVMGWNVSIAVYEIDDKCGDTLNDNSTAYFSPYTYACKQASLDVFGMFPGFRFAQAPRFTDQGSKLSLYVYANNQTRFAWLGPSGTNDDSSEPLYIAFGDSFSSGEGETGDAFYIPATNTPQNRCHVSSRSYPYLIGNTWNITTVNKACSGSRIDDVEAAATVVARESASQNRPSLLSRGVGGNDIELMGKLKTCLAIRECEWAAIEKRRATSDEIKSLFPRVVELIQSLKLEYTESRLALIGYPIVVNTIDTPHCNPFVSTLLNKEERRYMNESIKYLNKVLKAAAYYTNTTYISTEDAFIGERLCEGSERAMNSVRIGDDIAPLSFLSQLKLIGAESFHPTPYGHQLMAIAIQSKGTAWGVGDCIECAFDADQLSPSEYWREGDGYIEQSRSQKAEKFLSTTDLNSGDEVAFRFTKGTFTPGSIVTLEVHSEVTQLGEYVAGEDGSLAGMVTILQDIEGYHTIHAYGTSQSGTEYDLYQTIAVGRNETGKVTDDSGAGSIPMRQNTAPIQSVSTQPNNSDVLGNSVVSMGLPLDLIKNTVKPNDDKATPNSDVMNKIIPVILSVLVVGGLIAWLVWRRNKPITD